MSDSFSSIKKGKKFKKESLRSSRNIFHNGNSLMEINSESRISSISSLRSRKLGSNNSFISEAGVTSYDAYELNYSNYLLRKLQCHLLTKDKKEKEENMKTCLVSLKIELEDLLSKNVCLNRKLIYMEMYMNTIQKCNKRIELGKILEVLEKNNLDVWFKSVSDVLNEKINQLSLVGLSKTDVKSFFNREVIGEGSELFECLKRVSNFSRKNKDKIRDIAEDIVEIQRLIGDNSILREKYQNVFNNIAWDFLERNYKTLTSIVKESCDKRSEWKNAFTSGEEQAFELEKLLDNILSISQISSIPALKINNTFDEEPKGTSTPQVDDVKSCAI